MSSRRCRRSRARRQPAPPRSAAPHANSESAAVWWCLHRRTQHTAAGGAREARMRSVARTCAHKRAHTHTAPTRVPTRAARRSCVRRLELSCSAGAGAPPHRTQIVALSSAPAYLNSHQPTAVARTLRCAGRGGARAASALRGARRLLLSLETRQALRRRAAVGVAGGARRACAVRTARGGAGRGRISAQRDASAARGDVRRHRRRWHFAGARRTRAAVGVEWMHRLRRR